MVAPRSIGSGELRSAHLPKAWPNGLQPRGAAVSREPPRRRTSSRIGACLEQVLEMPEVRRELTPGDAGEDGLRELEEAVCIKLDPRGEAHSSVSRLERVGTRKRDRTGHASDAAPSRRIVLDHLPLRLDPSPEKAAHVAGPCSYGHRARRRLPRLENACLPERAVGRLGHEAENLVRGALDDDALLDRGHLDHLLRRLVFRGKLVVKRRTKLPVSHRKRLSKRMLSIDESCEAALHERAWSAK